jgi:hypothetical protein
MRVLLAVYLVVAQWVPGAVALAPPPPNIAEVSRAHLAAQRERQIPGASHPSGLILRTRDTGKSRTDRNAAG